MFQVQNDKEQEKDNMEPKGAKAVVVQEEALEEEDLVASIAEQWPKPISGESTDSCPIVCAPECGHSSSAAAKAADWAIAFNFSVLRLNLSMVAW